MAKKAFIVLLIALLATFCFVLVIKYYRPDSGSKVSIEQFPMQKETWTAQTFPLSATVIELLRPDAIFSALYTDDRGGKVDLFFSYFAGENTEGGVHSPRNCMPGSGWQIIRSEERQIKFGSQNIPASRLWIRFGDQTQIVDFWYITQHGETANDYKLKLYQMLSALSFQPTDVAFVRFICADTPASLDAMDRFQQSFGPEIYALLPFHKEA
jgi:EpsI family protein